MKKLGAGLLRFLKWLSFPFVGIGFVWMYVSALIKARGYAKNKERYGLDYRFRKVYNLVALVLYFKDLKIDVRGLDKVPKKAVLFACNHKSNLDPLALIKVFRDEKEWPLISFVAKKELLKKGFGKILTLIDIVFIDRADIRQAAASIEDQEKLIRGNVSLGIFPEGTRVPGDELGEFHGGALKAAYRAFVPIVPVAIYGSEGRMEKTADDGRRFRKAKGRRVVVQFLPPRQPMAFMNVGSQAEAANVREAIGGTLAKLAAEVKR